MSRGKGAAVTDTQLMNLLSRKGSSVQRFESLAAKARAGRDDLIFQCLAIKIPVRQIAGLAKISHSAIVKIAQTRKEADK